MEKVSLFRTLFTGVKSVYGTYDPRTGRAWQVKRPVTDRVLLDHLVGRKPYGVYLLNEDRLHAAAVDFDFLELEPVSELLDAARDLALTGYVERSKSKGHHVWFFFRGEGPPAKKARFMLKHLLRRIGCPTVEVFPKQDQNFPERGHYGNFINAPLFGRLVPEGRTVFLDPLNDWIPFPNQWELLDRVQRIPESALDAIIAAEKLTEDTDPGPRQMAQPTKLRSTWPLPPCAQNMLAQGVTDYQRVACFRLAVQLRKAGLPFELTSAALLEWRNKNSPRNGRRTITPNEVRAQTAAAYLKEYTGCGCESPAVEPYCQPACHLYARAKRDQAPQKNAHAEAPAGTETTTHAPPHRGQTDRQDQTPTTKKENES